MPNRTYFLGCPTPAGFETHLGDDIKSGKYFTYIIKGGPGTGKSTMMKRLAAMLSDVDSAELYYCSSDPDSLDAIVFKKLGVIFVDGTAPHVFEPTYPGAREKLLDLGRFWDSSALMSKADEIVALSDENRRLHSRAKRYLGAVCSISDDILSAGEAAMLKDKLDSFSKRLASKLFPKTSADAGKIKLRQITSVTPKGVITQEAAFEGYEKFAIADPCLAVTDALLKNLSTLASDAGYDVIVSKNVFLSGTVYEHMTVPKLKLAFVSSDTADAEGVKKINALRFYDRMLLRERKKRIAFNSGAKRELSYAAVEALSRAKTVHDELEARYIEAMNFDEIERLTEDLAEKLLKMA